MYRNISTFQRKGKYTRHRLPLKHFTQKWLDQKWVKRKADEDAWSVWDWEVIAVEVLAFKDRNSSARQSLGGKSSVLVWQAILARPGG
jgi:hypothetical protein